MDPINTIVVTLLAARAHPELWQDRKYCLIMLEQTKCSDEYLDDLERQLYLECALRADVQDLLKSRPDWRAAGMGIVAADADWRAAGKRIVDADGLKALLRGVNMDG